ncbi:MAG: phage tail tape measure protein [Deltaproteobacteria bacterium]|nr:phage tail tape measure protein [Deltaproteobacteria bacterium]
MARMRQDCCERARNRWWTLRVCFVRYTMPALLLFISSAPLRAQDAPPADPEPLSAADQVVVATQLNAGAERASRLAQDAAQKVADSVRAHRRAIWMTRTAAAIHRRDRNEYAAAKHGAELARMDRDTKSRDAKSAVAAANMALDDLVPLADQLREPDSSNGRDLEHASNRVVDAATSVKDAVRPVKESLLEVDTVRVRLELAGKAVDEKRNARIEEAVARRRLALNDSVQRLALASQDLATATEILSQAGGRPGAVSGKRSGRFGGLGGGVGLGFNFDVGGKSRVETARIVETKDPNGTVTARVVRVDKENNDVPHIMLEGHYFVVNDKPVRMPWCGSEMCKDREEDGSPCWLCGVSIPKEHVGVGPFVAVQPGSSDVVDAVGGGVMVGVRQDGLINGDSVNLGLGYFADPNTRVLGDGFSENKAPPAGETQVRYKDTTKSGIMLLMSYGF